MTSQFLRLSSHVITICGSTFIAILLVCHHFQLMTSQNLVISFSDCAPTWVTNYVIEWLAFVLSLGLVYSTVTELYIAFFGQFFDEDKLHVKYCK